MPGPRCVVCGDQKALDETWQRHTGLPAKVYYSQSPAPVVDFSRYMVVFVFDGATANSQGIGFTSITRSSAEICVRFHDYFFQTIGEATHVSPWGMAILPRSNARLIFERDVRGTIRGPALWSKEGEVSLAGKRDTYRAPSKPRAGGQ